MARGRNGASKKPETSSSVSEGRVWEVPSQKEKNRFNYQTLHYKGGFPQPLVIPPAKSTLFAQLLDILCTLNTHTVPAADAPSALCNAGE